MCLLYRALPSPASRRALGTLSRMREREGTHRASDGKGEGERQDPLFSRQLRQDPGILQAVEAGDRLAQLAGAGGADHRGGERVEFLREAAALVGDIGIGNAGVEG